MKTSMNTKLQTLVGMMIFGLSLNVGAAGNCSLTTFQRNVTSIKEISPDAVKVKQTMIPDTRVAYRRSEIGPDSPYYGLQAIGKVTASRLQEGQPGFKESALKEENSAFGTGFLISPCHMITNYHVPCEKEIVDGKPVCKTGQNLLGKSVNFSYGENANGNDFLNRVTGKIVSADSRADFAIVKIDSLKNKTNIPFIIPDFIRPETKSFPRIENASSVVAGYSILSQGSTNHIIYGMDAILSRQGPYIQGDFITTPGNSGTPTVYMLNNKLYASGIVSKSPMNSNGQIITVSQEEPRSFGMPTIGLEISAKNPSLYQEILNSIDTGRCE